MGCCERCVIIIKDYKSSCHVRREIGPRPSLHPQAPPSFGSPPPARHGAIFPKSLAAGATSINASPTGAPRDTSNPFSTPSKCRTWRRSWSTPPPARPTRRAPELKKRSSIDWRLLRRAEYQNSRRLRRLGQPAALQADPRQPVRRRRAVSSARRPAGRRAACRQGR